MTLGQEREIVRRFMAGDSVWIVAVDMFNRTSSDDVRLMDLFNIEDTLRDYINDKFTLESKRKVRSRV